MKQSAIPVNKVQIGTVLVADAGFTCLHDHELCVVNEDSRGELYVRCEEGLHGLDGQYCDRGEHGLDYDHYVGFWLKGEEPPQKPAGA